MTPKEREQRQLAPVKTGLYVKAENGTRLRDRKVSRLVAKVRDAMPWLEDSDEPTLRGWCQLEVLGTAAFAELRARGLLNAQGEPKRLLTDLRQLRQTQLAYARELGLTPAARKALTTSQKADDVTGGLTLQQYMALPPEARRAMGGRAKRMGRSRNI